MKKSKWWHFRRWLIRTVNKPREHKQWLQEYENFMDTATSKQLSQFLSDMRAMEEIETQAREIDGDIMLNKVISIVNILLLIAGVSMIIYACITACFSDINAEVIVYFTVGTLSFIYAAFDLWCKKHT